jgi:hypothetical protein
MAATTALRFHARLTKTGPEPALKPTLSENQPTLGSCALLVMLLQANVLN